MLDVIRPLMTDKEKSALAEALEKMEAVLKEGKMDSAKRREQHFAHSGTRIDTSDGRVSPPTEAQS